MLTPEQFRAIVFKLPRHVNMLAMTSACLGLRISETLGLQWSDIDWQQGTVIIRRSAYRGSIRRTEKNTSYKAKLPLHPGLAEMLLAWKLNCSLSGYSPIPRPGSRTCPQVCNSGGFDLPARGWE